MENWKNELKWKAKKGKLENMGKKWEKTIKKLYRNREKWGGNRTCFFSIFFAWFKCKTQMRLVKHHINQNLAVKYRTLPRNRVFTNKIVKYYIFDNFLWFLQIISLY